MNLENPLFLKDFIEKIISTKDSLLDVRKRVFQVFLKFRFSKMATKIRRNFTLYLYCKISGLQKNMFRLTV